MPEPTTTRGPIDFGDLLIAVAETLDDIRLCICCGEDSTWAGLYVHDLGKVTVSAWCDALACELDRLRPGESLLALPIDHLPALRRPVITEPRRVCDPLPETVDDAQPEPLGTPYPAGHGWTPGHNKFGGGGCRVMLARYPCDYPKDAHDPDLPPVDVDVFGYRRGRLDPTGPAEAQRLREEQAECERRWPGAESGLYDPRCCRFPKSCSAPDVDLGVEEPVVSGCERHEWLSRPESDTEQCQVCGVEQ